MIRTRLPTLFFVMFLMIVTPLTPMASAVEARTENLTAFINWENKISGITIADHGQNNGWVGSTLANNGNYTTGLYYDGEGHSAITFDDIDGEMHFVYTDYTSNHLMYDRPLCSNCNSFILDNINGGGEKVSIAVDSSANVHISYHSSIDSSLKYVMIPYGAAPYIPVTLDDSGAVGYHNSITVDSSDNVHISYYSYSGGDLKYITRGPTGSWSAPITIPDPASGDHVGEYSSIVADSIGGIHISYHSQTTGDLLYTYCNSNSSTCTISTSWSTPEILDITTDHCRHISIAVDSVNTLHISFQQGNGDLAYVSKTSSGMWSNPIILHNGGSTGLYTSLAVDSNDHVHISYYSNSVFPNPQSLSYVSFDGNSWSAPIALDVTGKVGLFTSLAIDADDDIHITYYDATNEAIDHQLFEGNENLADVSGYYSKMRHDLEFSEQINDVNPSDHSAYYSQSTNLSLIWIDTIQTGITDNWGMVEGELTQYSQSGEDFCLLGGTVGSNDSPGIGNKSIVQDYDDDYCVPMEIESHNYSTMPVIELNLENAVIGYDYQLDWWIIDCVSNNSLNDGSLWWTASTSDWEYTLSFPEYDSGNYFIEVALSYEGTGAFSTFDTACTGTPPGNSGNNNPPGPTISSHHMSYNYETGLHVGESEVTNLTASTSYFYGQYLYPSYSAGPIQVCDESNGYLLHKDTSLSLGAAYDGLPIQLQPFTVGSNSSHAYPMELDESLNYCYKIVFSEASPSSNVTVMAEKTFSSSPGFDGCSSNEWCWDEELSNGQGFSFSGDGEYIHYYHPPNTTNSSGYGNAIANNPIPPGKWYWEYEINRQGGSEMWTIIGVHTGQNFPTGSAFSHANAVFGAGLPDGWGFDPLGFLYHDQHEQITLQESQWWKENENYNIGIALDNEAGNLWYSLDGQWLAPSGTNSSDINPNNGAIPAFGVSSGGTLSEWDLEHGDNGLANTTVYPAVSDTSRDIGHNYRMLTSGEIEFTLPSGFTALPSNGFSTINESIDDSEIEFCYDYQNKDIEDSYTEENECTDAGFMWSTDELKNLDISLDWAWGDYYNGDGIEEANLEVSLMFPDTENNNGYFPGLHEVNIRLEIRNNLGNLQLTYIDNQLRDLENIFGTDEFLEVTNWPQGDNQYCIFIEIREEASGDTLSLDGICEEMNVLDVFSLGTDDSSDTHLYANIEWMPGDSGGDFGQFLLNLNAFVNEELVTEVVIDFSIASNSLFANTGLMTLNAQNRVSYNINLVDAGYSFEMYNTYCLELTLKSVIDDFGEILDNSLGCIYLGDNPASTSEVDWDSNLETGTTSVTSAEEGYEGNLAVDDDYETTWTSEFSCQDEDQEIIIDLPGHFDGNYNLVSGISLEWYHSEIQKYEIFAWSSAEQWESLMLVDSESLETDFSNSLIHHVFHKIEASRIKVSCLESDSNSVVQLAEIEIHPWKNPDSNGGGMMDAYYPNDLSEGAVVTVTSYYEDNLGAKVTDDDIGTFWESDGDCPQDIMIDLGQEYLVAGIKIIWDQDTIDSASYFSGEIREWSNQNGWNTVHSFNQNMNHQVSFIHLNPQNAQKVMLKCFEFDHNLKISEFEIYEAKPNWYQFDFDNDGKMNGNDNCFIGQNDWLSDSLSDYDSDGCKDEFEDWDDDNDGINDEQDNCPKGQFNWNSWDDDGTDNDHDGCNDETEDIDDDEDGVLDINDSCLETRLGAGVDASGCEVSFDDDDGDGVADSYDQCPNTEIGAEVDGFNGCLLGNDYNIEIFANFDQRTLEFEGQSMEVQSDEGWPSVQFIVYGLDVGTQYGINAKMWDYSVFPEEEMFCNNWPSQIVSGPCENSWQFTAEQEQMTITLHYPVLESSTQACLLVKLFEDSIEKQNDMSCWNQNSISDWDFDGVIDINDNCGATPINSTVNETGCLIIDAGNETGGENLLDSDGDGVTDLDSNGAVLDTCPDTEEGIEVDEFGCSTEFLLPPALASALDFILNIDSLLGLPDGTLEIMFAAVGMMFGVLRFAGKRTLAGKSRRVEKYASEIRMARSRRELENLEKRIAKDNNKKLLPPGGFGDLMELIEMRAMELGEMDMANQVRETAAEEESMRDSHDRMLEEMEGTREAVAGLQEELSEIRRKGPPGKGRGGRKGPPRRGDNDSGYKIKESGGPRRPSLHPADLDGDGFVTDEEKKIYRERKEQEDGLWEYD